MSFQGLSGGPEKRILPATLPDSHPPKPTNCYFRRVLKRVIMSVTTDLVTDQRVHRAASTLKESGYQVLVVGRRLPGSLALPGRKYRTRRLNLWFNKGPLFYAEYNIRLLFFLLFNKSDVLHSNDLDTLPANYLASRLKGTPLVYDSHEYFTGVPELVNRPKVQAIWKRIERWILPHIRFAYTVNESIARLYKEEYNVDFLSVRNVPEPSRYPKRDKVLLRRELNLPTNRKIVLLQGAGINIQRGAEEAVLAMKYTNDALLLIVGGGDVIAELKKMTVAHQLQEKVKFIPKKPPAELRLYTEAADIGISLDKDTNINYRYSLPNKLFDYIHAGLPVLASNLPEIRKVVEGYSIGRITESHDPEIIAGHLKAMLPDEALAAYRPALDKASSELNWDKERQKLIQLFQHVGEL